MSCWVVPSLAAEVWQIPLEQILRRIRDGELPVRLEDGFTFVDVAPYGPRVERPMLAPEDRPPTFTPVEEPVALEPMTEQELVALSAPVPAPDDREDQLEDETQSKVLGDWRAARKKAGRQRIPPPPRRLSA